MAKPKANPINPGLDELLGRCEATPDRDGVFKTLSMRVRAAIAAGDANTAASAAFTLGEIYADRRLRPFVDPELRRWTGKLLSKGKRAAENRDRVNALVNCKGMNRSDAIQKVAEERGVTVRSIQRDCKQERQD